MSTTDFQSSFDRLAGIGGSRSYSDRDAHKAIDRIWSQYQQRLKLLHENARLRAAEGVRKAVEEVLASNAAKIEALPPEVRQAFMTTLDKLIRQTLHRQLADIDSIFA